MTTINRISRAFVLSGIAIASALAIAVIPTSTADAATTIDGPLNLGSAAAFGVLGSSTVTNTGSSVLSGDLGVSPGTAITGFPPGIDTGTTHATDPTAANAKSDLRTAFNVAASLTPTTKGLGDLVGLSLVPGVYSGGALSLSGTLTLTGSATSTWVFQAASTLITSSASHIIVTGGATACNVFWKVGSSATLGSGSQFVGTVLAADSITADTGTTVAGRLLANTDAVTLDDTTLTAPTGCADASGTHVLTSPIFTSANSKSAAIGAPFAFHVTAVGAPTAPTFAVTAGTLPAGLVLNNTTGMITGTPSTLGRFSFTVTASNGVGPAATAAITINVLNSLAFTGVNPIPGIALGSTLSFAGIVLLFLRPRRSTTARARHLLRT